MNHPPSHSQPAPPNSRFAWTIVLCLGIIAATTFLGFIAGAVVTYIMPKKYESSAVIQIFSEQANSTSTFANSPQQLTTAMEMMRSQEILLPVIKQLDLTNSWQLNEQQSLAILQKVVTCQLIHGTDLIEISVKHTSAEDARNIAKEVYECYKTHGEKNSHKKDEQIDKGREKDAPELITRVPRVVELHEEPVIAQFPSSPNVTLNLILGAASGFLLGLLIALLIGLFTHRRNRRATAS